VVEEGVVQSRIQYSRIWEVETAMLGGKPDELRGANGGERVIIVALANAQEEPREASCRSTIKGAADASV
jgi:hypothetical protein